MSKEKSKKNRRTWLSYVIYKLDEYFFGPRSLSHRMAKMLKGAVEYLYNRPLLRRMIDSELFPILVFLDRVRLSIREITEHKILEEKSNDGSHDKVYPWVVRISAHLNFFVSAVLAIALLVLRMLLIESLVTGRAKYIWVSFASAAIGLLAAITFISINAIRLHFLARRISRLDPASDQLEILNKKYSTLKKQLIFNTSLLLYSSLGIAAFSINPALFITLFVTIFICYKVYNMVYPESSGSMNFMLSPDVSTAEELGGELKQPELEHKGNEPVEDLVELAQHATLEQNQALQSFVENEKQPSASKGPAESSVTFIDRLPETVTPMLFHQRLTAKENNNRPKLDEPYEVSSSQVSAQAQKNTSVNLFETKSKLREESNSLTAPSQNHKNTAL